MKLLVNLLLCILIAQLVFANTEKVILRVKNEDVPDMTCSELLDMSTKILLPSFTELRDSITPNTQQKNYRLDNLKEGSTYEVRLSYPAITPADFYMRILGNCKNEHGLRTYLLNISAKATGVSAAKDIEKETVTYNLVIAIIAVLCLGYFVIIPHVKQFIKTKIA